MFMFILIFIFVVLAAIAVIGIAWQIVCAIPAERDKYTRETTEQRAAREVQEYIRSIK